MDGVAAVLTPFCRFFELRPRGPFRFRGHQMPIHNPSTPLSEKKELPVSRGGAAIRWTVFPSTEGRLVNTKLAVLHATTSRSCELARTNHKGLCNPAASARAGCDSHHPGSGLRTKSALNCDAAAWPSVKHRLPGVLSRSHVCATSS